MTLVRRILGIIMIAVGVVGLVIALGIAVYGRQVVDSVGTSVDLTINVLLNTIGTTADSLVNVKTTVDEASQTLVTVADTATNLSATIINTEPLLSQVTALTTETVPNSLDAVQQAVPNLAGIASSVDTALLALSDLSVERTILGIPLSFDLGLDYNPEEPFDTAVLSLGDSLVGVPEQLRSLETNLQVAIDNVNSVAEDVQQLSVELGEVSGTITRFGPLLDEYIDILDGTKETLLKTREQLRTNLGLIKWVVTGLGVWFALYQVMPLYVGWRMLTQKEEEDSVDRVVVVSAGDSGPGSKSVEVADDAEREAIETAEDNAG